MTTIERDPYLDIVAMSAASARTFAMPNAFKVVCVGQANPKKYRFGSRVYRLFATSADYQRYLGIKRVQS